MRLQRLLLAPVLLAVFALPSCRGPAVMVARVAQEALRPFSFSIVGSASGEVSFNSRYLAVNAEVDVEVVYRAPLILGGPPVVVWRRTFERGSGQRAYEVVFSSEEGKRFLTIRSVPWSAARTDLRHLSAPDHVPYIPDSSTVEILREESP